MRCVQCGRSGDAGTVLSTHRTSQGWVRYRRCACRAVSIELVTLDGRSGTRAETVREPVPTF